ncbi:hypothetical protein SLINC_4093 [Streptomyces lincolnensis]|uniref:Uncharacterized protein n=1 Tax=Streptomyces lincolnensis TaxID=1915 RepID=A0A1B1MCW3_STRLN|nr:hypothetical protein [Streptomyces lincolnensis]ANS66317.1 hypothetical protein SLINC_4093 [Streptomyces lincolnensis]AXG55187.1 hypothetical protein SLCG_4032 [Streptomyces lincolnensis]QMV08299.1 hypothetical protein GJU35_23400 [Streptomyces lincolnensis]
MCPDCEDFARTVLLLGQLALYADVIGADQDFVEALGPSLAASLPEPPPGVFPSGYDPEDGPDYPGTAS